jgi:LAO/AO transport system kinase
MSNGKKLKSRDADDERPGRQLNPKLDGRALRRRLHPPAYYVEGIRRGDRVVLGQAITLTESALPAHREVAQEVVDQCLSAGIESVRIGITGTPGVGKSTFIEAFGLRLLDEGRKVAVLAIDPSSRVSHGSILGDKTRMQELSLRPEAFIRPSPAGETLGGVAEKTREVMLLCEAAGFDTILVETVGVGQSETAVHSMTDFFLLLLQPGAGDELQGIKRGIVEMADLIAVNKSDGDREAAAKQAQRAYRNALHLLPPKASRWPVKVVRCSALQRTGIAEVWQWIGEYLQMTRENGYFISNRREQARYWLHERIQAFLRDEFYSRRAVQEHRQEIERAVADGTLSPAKAATMLINLFRGA